MDFACSAVFVVPRNGGGLFRSATRASLSRRSASMALSVLWARVCRRSGIITPRSPVESTAGGSPIHNVPVGAHSFGNRCLVPGCVEYVSPVGEVRITVPSGNFLG